MASQSDPPFRRIADEIARRIAEGTLAPGERVPSTRQIAREWGVALATATKALTTLRLEGLVEARPRVGTVVAARESAALVEHRAPSKRRPPSMAPLRSRTEPRTDHPGRGGHRRRRRAERGVDAERCR
ncbi:hypothetical protein GCM10020000_82430 [Streptomyces olivoverticillatus]